MRLVAKRYGKSVWRDKIRTCLLGTHC